MSPLSSLLYRLSNFYGNNLYSQDSNWFTEAQKSGLIRNPHLVLANDTDFLKLKKIEKAIDLAENYARTNHLSRQEVKILDVGCGDGVYTFVLGNMGFNVLGIDVSKDQIMCAKERAARLGIKNVHLEHANVLTHLKYCNERYNIILVADVMEHMESPREFLSLSFRRLTNPGLIIAIVPNGYGLIELLYTPLAQMINERLADADYKRILTGHGWFHAQRYSLKKIENLLVDSGFKFRFANSVYSDLLAFLFLRGFRNKITLINLQMAERLPRRMVGSWVVCGVKNDSYHNLVFI